MTIRNLTIGDKVWRYTVSERVVVIWSPTKKRRIVRIQDMVGLPNMDLERARYKGSRDVNVQPSHIRQYIETLL